MNEKLNISLNSTMLYVMAFIMTTIFHEFAHALLGLLHNSDPVIHHNYVEHLSTSNLTAQQQVSIAFAGPILSLCQGLICGWIFLKRENKGIYGLFLLWFAVLGFNNFLGYLMTGPFFSAGDIGKSYQLLDTPLWIQVISALLGAALLLYIAYKITKPFLQFGYKTKWLVKSRARKNFSFHILILPWILGSVIMTFLYMPIIAIVSIIYPVMSGFVFIYPWQNATTIENVQSAKSNNLGKLSIKVLVLLVVLILIFKFLLAPGIKL